MAWTYEQYVGRVVRGRTIDDINSVSYLGHPYWHKSSLLQWLRGEEVIVCIEMRRRHLPDEWEAYRARAVQELIAESPYQEVNDD
jgi:hypothetical protein